MENITIAFLDSRFLLERLKINHFWHSKMDSSFADFKMSLPKEYRHKIQKFKITTDCFDDAFIEDQILIFQDSKYLKKTDSFKDSFDETEIINIFIDMDDTILMYSKLHKEELERCPNMAYPQSKYGFFLNLEPYTDAIRVIKRLIADERFNVEFATAPAIFSPMSYTEKRVSIEKLFSFEDCKRLNIINNKGLLTGRNSLLIDDLKEGRGQENFTGKQIVFGDDFIDWNEIETFIFNS